MPAISNSIAWMKRGRASGQWRFTHGTRRRSRLLAVRSPVALESWTLGTSLLLRSAAWGSRHNGDVTERHASLRRLRVVVRLTGLAAYRGFLGFLQGDNLTYAASVAYYALLSLFPLSMLALAVLGSVTADERDRTAVLDFVLRYFPRQFDFITRQLDAFRANRLSFGVLGTLALVWGALGVFGAISTAVNYAWRVEKPRSYWGHKLFSFLMLVVAGVVLLVALLLVSATQVVSATWFAGVLSGFPGLLVLRSFAVRHATTALFIVVVGLVYYFVPNAKVRFRDVWIGALITGLLWKLALEAFSWYMRDMSRFTQVNGSIAATVAFLFWVYLQAVILLYGAELTAAYARLNAARKTGVG